MSMSDEEVERRIKALERVVDRLEDEVRELRELTTPTDSGSLEQPEVRSQSIAENDRQHMERVRGANRA